MKKTMIASAVVFSALAGFSDVSSANVVGYVNDGLTKSESRVVGSQFLKVGTDGTTMTLGDLTPGGKWVMGSSDKIKVLTTGAAVKFTAFYVDAATASRLATRVGHDVAVGWYADSDASYKNCLNDEPLPFGTAVIAVSGQNGAYITSSGEVVESETGRIQINLVKSESKLVCNCAPNNCTLGDFIPGGKWVMGSSDKIKVLTTGAAVKFTAFYVDAATASRLATRVGHDVAVGWYADSDASYKTCLNDEPIPAGGGVIAVSGQTGAYMTVPSAL